MKQLSHPAFAVYDQVTSYQRAVNLSEHLQRVIPVALSGEFLLDEEDAPVSTEDGEEPASAEG